MLQSPLPLNVSAARRDVAVTVGWIRPPTLFKRAPSPPDQRPRRHGFGELPRGRGDLHETVIGGWLHPFQS